MHPPQTRPHLVRYREFLVALGRSRLGRPAADRVDLSGVVQETLIEAHRAGDRFPGADDRQARAWLARVFGFNLADAVRRLRAGRRDAARELPLGPGDPEPAADHSTPSGRAGRAEERDRLASAVARLPADQRAAVELHHLHGLPLAAVAARMGRTQPAVAGLLFRGLKKLRELLPDG